MQRIPSRTPKKKMQNFFTFLLFIDNQLITILFLAREREHMQKPNDYAPSRKNFQKKFGK